MDMWDVYLNDEDKTRITVKASDYRLLDGILMLGWTSNINAFHAVILIPNGNWKYVQLRKIEE